MIERVSWRQQRVKFPDDSLLLVLSHAISILLRYGAQCWECGNYVTLDNVTDVGIVFQGMPAGREMAGFGQYSVVGGIIETTKL